MHHRWLAPALGALLLAACSGPSEDDRVQVTAPAAHPSPGPEAVAANNRGVGLMGRFEYARAAEVFEALARRYPGWQDIQVNLAIAVLNRQQEGDEQAALERVERVLAQDPGQLRAHYVAGLLRLYLASPREALEHFRVVHRADPSDAYAAYYLGQCLAQTGHYAPALEAYRQAISADPYLRSAYYGAFQALQRLRRSDAARELVGDYRRLGKNPRAHLAEFKYTRMGPKAAAVALDTTAPEPPTAPPAGPLFAAGGPLPAALPLPPLPAAGRAAPLSITPVGLPGAAAPDILVAGAPGVGLYLRAGADGYRPLSGQPLAGAREVRAVLWGDYDNDGRIDAYLCRRGPNQLWRQERDGSWTDVSTTTGTAAGDHDTVGGAFLDADHDGDLDLFVVHRDAPNELLSNNLDGSFRPLAADRGLAGDGRPSRAVLPVDLDRDRDVDLLVLHEMPPHEAYVNDRLWRYRPAEGLDELLARPALAMIAGDLDADGWPEIYSIEPRGALRRWRPNAAGHYRARVIRELALAPGPGEAADWAELAVLDANGDGTQELLVAGPAGWWVVAAGDGAILHRPEHQAALAGATTVLRDPVRGPEVLAMTAGGELRLWAAGSGRQPYLALTLSGREDNAQSMRSNASGIGARVQVRRGSHWTLPPAYLAHSGPGQAPQPVSVGLGGADHADFVSIDWSDGVLQTELDLSAGPHHITETQRQLSSCPVLFAWDGQRYAFVSDLLGVGGIGYAVGPGEYATPRPWEHLLLPRGLLARHAGRYRLKITEPMEETAYLDSVRLLAWDLPPGWEMVIDERMGTSDPQPTGAALFYREEVLPSRVTDAGGHDLTEVLGAADGRAAPVGRLDARFIGRLAEPLVLTLYFAEPLDTRQGRPILVADGWVEYPYSQTMFAAWQAGASYAAPTLEARSGEGPWQVVWRELGYPAGMPRRMAAPLDALPPGTTALRVSTNQQIYWDRLAIAYATAPEHPPRRQVLELRSARVAQTGFPAWRYAAQRRPELDYSRRRPFYDLRYMAGLYTRPGPARELLTASDDALAIIGAGDEVHLEFVAPEAAPPAGWSRRLVLEAHGWAKDMDLYTRHGETVAPLPSRQDPPDARAALLNTRYNTRYAAGR